MIRGGLLATAVMSVVPGSLPDDCGLCSCGPPSAPAVAARSVAAVFVGRATAVGDSLVPADQFHGPPNAFVVFRVAQIEVEVSWKGPAPGRVVTVRSGPACTVDFREGERYIVYASRRPPDGGLWAHLCSRTSAGARLTADSATLSAGG
jgi:hypothetical protein